MPKSGTKLLKVDTPILLALTPDEAAASLRISKTRLYDLMRTGEIESYRIGRSRRVSTSALLAYQARLEAIGRESTA